MIGAGLLTGNIIGFFRVALTAYLLGTHSTADSLAVALGPIDALNAVLINSMVFGFVPMLTARSGAERAALFLKLNRFFLWLFSGLTVALVGGAPWLMRVLAPGLDPLYLPAAVWNFRILSLSTAGAGAAAIHCALLYIDRRFAPTAFAQAVLNLFTIVGALSLWKVAGVYGFAFGYTAGAWMQYGIVQFAARPRLPVGQLPECRLPWRELLAKPAFFVVYASGLALNITLTRAYATNAGPGVAAALDYSMRGVGVLLAILVSPMSYSLLPEIARLRSLGRLRQAFRLIDRSVAVAALLAVGGCTVAIVFREPAIALFFQRGSFSAESTKLVSAVFLGLGPAVIGWSLLEILSRSLVALDRPWPPLVAALILLAVNAGFGLFGPAYEPRLLGLGASAGLLAGFAVLLATARASRARWIERG
jgi:putative peptidoglycan lipid II flippase